MGENNNSKVNKKAGAFARQSEDSDFHLLTRWKQ